MTCVVPQWEGPGKVILFGWPQATRRPAGVKPAQFYGYPGAHRNSDSNKIANMEHMPGTALMLHMCDII